MEAWTKIQNPHFPNTPSLQVYNWGSSRSKVPSLHFHRTRSYYEIFAPLEAVAMTPDEWERGDSFISDFARNGEVLFDA